MKKSQVNYGFIVQGCEEDVIMTDNYLLSVKDRYGIDKIVFYEETEDLAEVEKALANDIVAHTLHVLTVEKRSTSIINLCAQPQYSFFVQSTGYCILDYVYSFAIRLMGDLVTQLGAQDRHGLLLPVEVSAYETSGNTSIRDLLNNAPLNLIESMDETSFTLTPALTTSAVTSSETLMGPITTILTNASNESMPHIFINFKLKNSTQVTFVLANPYTVLVHRPQVKKVGDNDEEEDDDDGNIFNVDDDDDEDSEPKLAKSQEACVEDMNVFNNLIKKELEKRGCNWNARLFTKLLKPHILNFATDTTCIGYIFDDELTALSQWTLSLLKEIKAITRGEDPKKASSDSTDSSGSEKDKVPSVKVLIHDSPSKRSLFASKKTQTSLSSSDSDETELKKPLHSATSDEKTKIRGTRNTSGSSSPLLEPSVHPKKPAKEVAPHTKKTTKDSSRKPPPQTAVPPKKVQSSAEQAKLNRSIKVNATPMKSTRKLQSQSATLKQEAALQEKQQPTKKQQGAFADRSVRAAKAAIPTLVQKHPVAQSLRPKSGVVHKMQTSLSQSTVRRAGSSPPTKTEKQHQQKASISDERKFWEDRERYLLRRLHEVEGLYAAQRNENMRLRMAFEDLKSVTEKKLGDIKDKIAAQNERYKQELSRYDSIVNSQATTIGDLQKQFLKLYQAKLSSVVIRREIAPYKNDYDDDDDDDDDYYYDRGSERASGGGKSFNNFCPCHTDMAMLERLVSLQGTDIKSLEKRLEMSERSHAQQKKKHEEEMAQPRKNPALLHSKPGLSGPKKLDEYKLPELEGMCKKVMDALDKCIKDVPPSVPVDELSSVDRGFTDRGLEETLKGLIRIREILEVIITHTQISLQEMN